VSLEILDVNDNSPEFPTSSVVGELLESSPVGTTLTVDSATDRDTTQFGVSRYELVPDDEPAASHFQLKVKQNVSLIVFHRQDSTQIQVYKNKGKKA